MAVDIDDPPWYAAPVDVVTPIYRRCTRAVWDVVGESAVRAWAWRAGHRTPAESSTPSIFVLRNNDIGDLLVITPLFDALRRRFPAARIVAGVGTWNVDVLRGNPHVSSVMAVDAPWFNRYTRATGVSASLAYLASSPDIQRLRDDQYDIGIDVLGSTWGALLMLRARIPYRLGIRGYAGGHSGVQVAVPYDHTLHVGRSALRFAEALGLAPEDLPDNRPQIFLGAREREAAQGTWGPTGRGRKRVVIGPGTGDRVKGWPLDRFRSLVATLAQDDRLDVCILGGAQDRAFGDELASLGDRVRSVAGHLTLREAFAVVEASDVVITNASMLMHAAAAFSRQTLVLLGPAFTSARAHDEQWGYPGTCLSLGREPGVRRDLATVEEVLDRVRAIVDCP